MHRGQQVSKAAYPEKFRRKLRTCFEARGIEFVFGDYIEVFPTEAELKASGVITTKNGRKIKADLVVRSTGPVPATGKNSHCM